MKIVALLASSLALGAAPAAAQTPKSVEVMVLGTYHFDNPGLDLANAKADDVPKPQRQKELRAIEAALAEFKPTKIMVERVAKSADLVDASYSSFSPATLATSRDERVQIAYRLANRLGMTTVYAIDEQAGDGEPDYFPFGKVAAWLEEHGQKARIESFMATAKGISAEVERLQSSGTIADVLSWLNDPVRTQQDQSLYYEALDAGDSEQQPGAELNAYWYMRNAKIFAKLQQVARPGDRVLVVYGSGHNYWLRHFAGLAPGYRNIDPVPFLKRARVRAR